MNYKNLIDSCQALLPVQFASNIKLIRQISDTGVVIDSQPHASRMCKTSILSAPLAVHVQAGCSTFPFYTPTKQLKRLYFKYKTVLTTKFKIVFIF